VVLGEPEHDVQQTFAFIHVTMSSPIYAGEELEVDQAVVVVELVGPTSMPSPRSSPRLAS
jgi:hypothetical protein